MDSAIRAGTRAKTTKGIRLSTNKKPVVRGDRNQCAGCQKLFNSSAAFDKHRTGDFGKDRRCMSTEQMEAKGMAVNGAGYWVTALNPQFSDHELVEVEA